MADQKKKSVKSVEKTDSKNKVKSEVKKKDASKKTSGSKKGVKRVDTVKNSVELGVEGEVAKEITDYENVNIVDKKINDNDSVENTDKVVEEGVLLNMVSNQNDVSDDKIRNSKNSNICLKRSKLMKKDGSSPAFYTSDVALLVLITCVISLLLGGLVSYRFIDKKVVDNDNQKMDVELQSFIKNYNYIVDNYYTEVNKKEVLDAAFKAMVDSLGDAYSGFIDESESNNFDITLRGSYTGLGVEVVNDADGNIMIYSIFKDSPAGRSDLKVGDILVRLNGQDVLGTATSEFTKVIQESSNEQFNMVVRRGTEEKSITIKKGFITLQSVVSKTFEKNGKKIGYLGVSIFAANTGSQFRSALENLEKDGIDGLVIDLRGNGGGHLFVVENMISEFLDSSHIIYQDESKTTKNKVYSTGSVTKTYPMSILVNGTSASASEVMTAALMEEYGAKVVGTKTYGKGTVQELHENSNGEEYKFTIKKWLTPKGNWINSVGINPDYEIVLNDAFYKNPSDDTDNQLQKAISVLFE